MRATIRDAKIDPSKSITSTRTALPRRWATQSRPGHEARVWRTRKKNRCQLDKSMTGHLLGGAGGLEAGISVLALRDQALPPTINQETPDPECDLDYVPNHMRKADVEYALSNSFGFGGPMPPAVQALGLPLSQAQKKHEVRMKIVVCIKQVPAETPRL